MRNIFITSIFSIIISISCNSQKKSISESSNTAVEITEVPKIKSTVKNNSTENNNYIFPINKTKKSNEVRVKELQENFWGMFICWSFSTFSGQEWTPTLDKDASYFKATNVDTDNWCQVAKDAGMTHILFLTKHHDGFCLWDTKTTKKKVTNSPLGVDVLHKLKKSCDKYGLKLALYFSEGDWNFPKAVDGKGGKGGSNPEVKKAQLTELLTNYGDIDWWWFDHAAGTGGLGHIETTELVTKLQPNSFAGYNHGRQSGRLALRELGSATSVDEFNKMLKNRIIDRFTRAGKDPKTMVLGKDYHQYEALQFTYPSFPRQKDGAAWFYSLPKYEHIVHPAKMIYDDVVKAKKRGNVFSLNVGPNYEGKIRDADAKMLREVGKMLRENKIIPAEKFKY